MSTLKVTNIKAADGTSALSIADGTGKVSLATNSDLALQGTGKVFAPNGIVFSSTELTGDDASTTTRTESSNLLDDYEEGTWTLSAYGASGSAGTYAQTVYGSPFYTKIGNIVTVGGAFSITNLGSYSGDFRIGTLPFSISVGDPNFGCYGSIRLQSTNYDTGASLLVEGGDGNSFARVQAVVSGTGNNAVDFSELTTSTYVSFTMTYRTN